jgi:hypothetical protein
VDESQLAKIRISRKRQFTDGALSYRVLIDDKEVGKVRSGQIAGFNGIPGEHVVQLVRQFPRYSRSNALTLDVGPGDICEVTCTVKLTLGTFVLTSLSFGGGEPRQMIFINAKDS